MDYSHFIITQFNLKNFPKSNNNDYGSWLSWTRKRIDLFREYCLPSVVNQSCKVFHWLIFFDADTPAEFSDFLGGLSAFPFISICYSRGIEDFNAGYMEELKKRREPDRKWIVTTRIDNDDCLHRDAIKMIQDNLAEKDKYLISLASGYILNLTDRTLSHYFYPMSPFLTLVEANNDDIKGVFEKGHTKWDHLRLYIFRELWTEYFRKESRKVRFILSSPLWVQTVHGENVSNNFYRGLPVVRTRDLSEFSLPFATRKLSPGMIREYWNYVIWKRYFKCLIIKALLKY